MRLVIRIYRKVIFLLELLKCRLTGGNHRYLANYIYDGFHYCVRSYILRVLKRKQFRYAEANTLNSTDKSSNKNIWILWWQKDDIPEIVKKNIEMIRTYSNHNVVFLNEGNITEYVKIPEFVFQRLGEGKIEFAFFSDYIRTALLYKYGGIWMDSTVYTANSDSEGLLNKSFYTAKGVNGQTHKFVSKGRWTIYLIGGDANKEYFRFVNQGLELFIRNSIEWPDYFLTDYLFDIAYRKNIGGFRTDVDCLEKNNLNMELLVDRLNLPFNATVYTKLQKSTSFFKLSHKNKYSRVNLEGESTYFGELISNGGINEAKNASHQK